MQCNLSQSLVLFDQWCLLVSVNDNAFVSKGCSSDISSMVTEAQSKVNEAVKQTIKCIGHLAVFTRTDISIFEENDIPATSLQVKKCLLEIMAL